MAKIDVIISKAEGIRWCFELGGTRYGGGAINVAQAKQDSAGYIGYLHGKPWHGLLMEKALFNTEVPDINFIERIYTLTTIT